MMRILSPRVMAQILAAIILFATAPILSLLASSVIASAKGCQLNEAAAHPCMILGIDIGGLLALMFVSGWLALMTLPAGFAALLVWLVVAIALFIRSRNGS